VNGKINSKIDSRQSIEVRPKLITQLNDLDFQYSEWIEKVRPFMNP
jgi:hypothetical protein